MNEHSPRNLIGQVLDGRFLVRDLVGMGGMGVVYRAEQQSMGRDVALKLLRVDLAADAAAERRFLTEAKAASLLKNPHSITVFDAGRTPDGVLYLVMELLDGRTLGRVLQEEGRPLPLGRVVRIVNQVLDSLDEAHRVGVLHRDLKPDNIFCLRTPGAEDFIKVLDFGVAKMIGEDRRNVTIAGVSFGTPAYMSPEQMMGQPVDARTDLYALGVLIIEMLMGQLPFDGDSAVAVALKKLREPVPPLRALFPEVEVPEKLDGFLARVLSADRKVRPGDAAGFRAAFRLAVDRRSRVARSSGAFERRDTVPEAVPDLAAESSFARAVPVETPGDLPADPEPVPVAAGKVPDAPWAPVTGMEFSLPTVPDLRDTQPQDMRVPLPDPEPEEPAAGASETGEPTNPWAADRRVGHRSQRLFKVTCILNGQPQQAVVADLSESGGFVHASWLPQVATRLEIVFRGEREEAPAIVVRSQVVRIVAEPGLNEVRGFSVRWVVFRSPGGAPAIARFLRKNVAKDVDFSSLEEPASAAWEYVCEVSGFRRSAR